jgi:Na+-transporting NADH:ubiquinone oxidoreductase subunit D
MPQGFTNWVVMAMAPGAFFVLAVFIWISRSVAGTEE